MNQQSVSVIGFAASFFGLLALLGLAVISLHLIIDPDNQYNYVNFESIESRKLPLIASGKDKTNLIKNTDANCIIIGTSRSELGINPEKVKGYQCINLSLMLGSVSDMLDILTYSQQHMDIKAIYFGIDYSMFMPNAGKVEHAYKVTTLQGNNSIQFSDFLSVTKLKAIADIIFNNEVTTSKTHYPNGQRKIGKWQKSFERNGHEKMFLRNERAFIKRKIYQQPYEANLSLTRKRARSNTRKQTRRTPTDNSDFVFEPASYQDNLTAFNNILANAKKHQINLYPFISPIHIRQLSVIHSTHQFENFKKWKLALLNAFNVSYSGTKLWDFSYIKGITDENVLTGKQTMQGYWESQHYKESLGDDVLHNIETINDTHLLGFNNINDVNQEQEFALTDYQKLHPNLHSKHINWAKRFHAFQ